MKLTVDMTGIATASYNCILLCAVTLCLGELAAAFAMLLSCHMLAAAWTDQIPLIVFEGMIYRVYSCWQNVP